MAENELLGEFLNELAVLALVWANSGDLPADLFDDAESLATERGYEMGVRSCGDRLQLALDAFYEDRGRSGPDSGAPGSD